VAAECEAVRRTIGVFLRWVERRQQTPDRTSGIAWLRAVSEWLASTGVVAKTQNQALNP
jgi:hypothetical protein